MGETAAGMEGDRGKDHVLKLAGAPDTGTVAAGGSARAADKLTESLRECLLVEFRRECVWGSGMDDLELDLR